MTFSIKGLKVESLENRIVSGDLAVNSRKSGQFTVDSLNNVNLIFRSEKSKNQTLQSFETEADSSLESMLEGCVLSVEERLADKLVSVANEFFNSEFLKEKSKTGFVVKDENNRFFYVDSKYSEDTFDKIVSNLFKSKVTLVTSH